MKILILVTFLSFLAFDLSSSEPLRIIVIGAHPDDCELNAGGTTILFGQKGHKVKFVSLANGNKGHHQMRSDALAARREKEYKEAGRRLGIEYVALDNNDGELMPTYENRLRVMRVIREWDADIVITHRPNDYHVDHRVTGQLVMDAAYMVEVPLADTLSKALTKTPLFLYMSDRFTKPTPFIPHIVVDITSVYDQKINAIDAHESQMYEWLPWIGRVKNPIPTDPNERILFLKSFLKDRGNVSEAHKALLSQYYPSVEIEKIEKIEAFEICEYGMQPTQEQILQLFPFFSNK